MCPQRTNPTQTLNFLLVGDDEQGKYEIMDSLPNRHENDEMVTNSVTTFKTTNIFLSGERIDLHIW